MWHLNWVLISTDLTNLSCPYVALAKSFSFVHASAVSSSIQDSFEPSHSANTVLPSSFSKQAIWGNTGYPPHCLWIFSVCVSVCWRFWRRFTWAMVAEHTASGFMAPYLRVALASSTSLLSHSEDKKIASTLVRSPLCPSTGCPCVAALHILAKVDHN